jgi:hypothetical protein
VITLAGKYSIFIMQATACQLNFNPLDIL